MNRKIVVPDDRVNRTWNMVRHLAVNFQNVKEILEAFAADLSQNPIVPTDEQIEDMVRRYPSESWNHRHRSSLSWYIPEFQRIAFLAPEPGVPEAIKDLIYEPSKTDSPVSVEFFSQCNERTIEAYRRGKAAK